MRKHFSRFFQFIKRRWLVVTIITVVILVIIIASRGGSNIKIDSTAAVIGDISERVSVTGKVLPLGKADLSFEKGGVVTTIAVKVGQTVKRGSLIASLNSADDAAALASARAQLAEVSRGLRPEEYANDKATLDKAATTLENSKKDAINASRDSYVKAQSALVNYADTFFNNPQSVNPTINIHVESTDLQNSINNARLISTEKLATWKIENDKVTMNDDINSFLKKCEGYLNYIKIFAGDLSVIVNKLSVSNSGFTQAEIDTRVSNMNTALSTLTQAVTALTTAETALQTAQSAYTQALNQFNLEKAGSSAENISAQSAKVEQARAQYAKNFIYAPIDGLITKADIEVGEFVSAGQSVFAVQSSGTFKIEAYIPEADIAKVSLGNKAEVTLDAYGSDVIFPATVTIVDPAETVLEGVPTYKTTLQFDQADTRIRSGMTANTEILTREVKNVLIVPTRAVVDDKGQKSVRLLNSDGDSYSTVPVVVGLKGSDGMIEIKSGLSVGQEIVTYVK